MAGYIKWLWILTAVFVFRVLGQLFALQFNIPFLAPFDQWYSGAVPYPLLLGIQVLIVAIMLHLSFRIGKGVLFADRTLGLFLQVAGWVYFIVMFIRWVIGMTDLLDITWFERPIPAFFHMVLAVFILLLAHYHKSASIRKG